MPAFGKFIPAGELQPGDLLISSDDQLIEVVEANSTDEVTTVYNLRVADHHTYFVGGAIWGWDVWVHNAEYGRLVLGNEIQTLSLSGTWRTTTFGDNASGIVYVLRDVQTGELLKVGKSTLATFTSRFAVYQKAGQRTGRNLQVDVMTIQANSGRTMESIEAEVRGTLIGQGHTLRWDNTGNRLGREGPGVPGASIPKRLRVAYKWNYGTESLEPR